MLHSRNVGKDELGKEDLLQSASSRTIVARPPILTLIYCQNDRAFAH
jgi:hypothetical protein